jgi:hypothetical protein
MSLDIFELLPRKYHWALTQAWKKDDRRKLYLDFADAVLKAKKRKDPGSSPDKGSPAKRTRT